MKKIHLLYLFLGLPLLGAPQEASAQCWECDYNVATNKHRVCEFGADVGWRAEWHGSHCSQTGGTCIIFHYACVDGEEDAEAIDFADIEALAASIAEASGVELLEFLAEDARLAFNVDRQAIQMRGCVEGTVAMHVPLRKVQVGGLTALLSTEPLGLASTEAIPR